MDPKQLVALTARDLMTTPPMACRSDAYLAEVAEILADRDISGMPVVDDNGEILGVISERDVAHALGGPLVKLAIRRPSSHRSTWHAGPSITAGDIMTVPALVVELSTPITEIARLMVSAGINRVPVVDEGRLEGVVTRGDVLGALAGMIVGTVPGVVKPTVVLGGTGVSARPAPFTALAR